MLQASKSRSGKYTPDGLSRCDRSAYLFGMLPEDFSWHVDDRYGHHWLRCGRHEVALVSERKLGEWMSCVNVQRWSGRLYGKPLSFQGSKRMVERWAMAHADRLRREVLDKRLGEPPVGDPRLSRAERRTEHKVRS